MATYSGHSPFFAESACRVSRIFREKSCFTPRQERRRSSLSLKALFLSDANSRGGEIGISATAFNEQKGIFMSRSAAILLSMFCVASAAQANRSVVTIHDSAISGGYTPSYYTNTDITTPEIHVIGVYETRSDHSGMYHPTGTAYVHVTGSADTPVNLVLSSYEPTQWILDGAGLSFISSININSYHVSTVVGFDSSKVTFTPLGTYGYSWPDSASGSNPPAIVNAVESLYGAPIATFSGVYRATEFSVALAPVPEPGSASLYLIGLTAGIAFARARMGQSRAGT